MKIEYVSSMDIKAVRFCLIVYSDVNPNFASINSMMEDMSSSLRTPSTLLQFLKEARQFHLRSLSGTVTPATTPVYVLGNPSADLDSIISAILYSYFAHRRLPNLSFRPHIPLLNLPVVPSGPELCRLRPEFLKAFWHATHASDTTPTEEKWAETPDVAGKVLQEHIITTHDFAQNLHQHPKPEASGSGNDNQITADAILVDWNALPIRRDNGKGSIPGLENVTFSVLGYIDHHADEGFVPGPGSLPSDQPAIITTAGSCTSLVTNYLISSKLWPEVTADTSTGESMHYQAQLATLALFAIYIDTARLTAKEKVTSADIEAEEFLRSRTVPAVEQAYEAVLSAKQNSLDLLSIEEILDRDFKVWTESPPSFFSSSAGGEKKGINLGFCSLVKPIPWLVRKVGTPASLMESLRGFATSKDLDVVVVMTAFTTQSGTFCRELFVSAMCEDKLVVDILETFVSRSARELGLQEWHPLDGEEDVDVQGIKNALNSDATGPWKRIWVQGDISKSRKQVAPLLRSAVGQS